MALTAKWWSTTKKGYKKAPKTGMKDALSKYEKDLAAFEKVRNDKDYKKSMKALDGVRKSLAELGKAGNSAIGILENKKHKDAFEDLAGNIRTGILGRPTRQAQDFIDEASDELEVKFQVATSSGETEAIYKRAWLAYEKQRKLAPSLEVYADLLNTLGKLEELAENVREESSGSPDTRKLSVTYTNQLKILASLKKSTVKDQDEYQKALDAAIKRRKDLLVEFKAVKKATVDARKIVDAVQKKAENPPEDAGAKAKLVAMLDLSIKKMDSLYTPANEEFKPGNTIRGSTDIKAANIHSDDSASHIRDILTALINTNKEIQKSRTAILKDADSIKGALA